MLYQALEFCECHNLDSKVKIALEMVAYTDYTTEKH